jgi:hypothetical protein
LQEIGLDEIKYNLPDPDNDILYSISKDKASRVVLENGEEIIIKDDFQNSENYVENKKNALKVDFLSHLILQVIPIAI